MYTEAPRSASSSRHFVKAISLSRVSDCTERPESREHIASFTRSFFLSGRSVQRVIFVVCSTRTKRTDAVCFETMKSPSQCPYAYRASCGRRLMNFLPGSFREASFRFLPAFRSFRFQNKNRSSDDRRLMNFRIDFQLAYAYRCSSLRRTEMVSGD